MDADQRKKLYDVVQPIYSEITKINQMIEKLIAQRDALYNAISLVEGGVDQYIKSTE